MNRLCTSLLTTNLYYPNLFQKGTIHASGTFKELEGKVDFSHLLTKDEEATQAKEKMANYIREETLSSYSSMTGESGREAGLSALSDAEVNILVIMLKCESC